MEVHGLDLVFSWLALFQLVLVDDNNAICVYHSLPTKTGLCVSLNANLKVTPVFYTNTQNGHLGDQFSHCLADVFFIAGKKMALKK